MTPNIRIARKVRTSQGVIIKTEVAGSWIVRPEEYPKSPKMDYIRRELSAILEEEPNLGWTLETKGDETLWHPVVP